MRSRVARSRLDLKKNGHAHEKGALVALQLSAETWETLAHGLVRGRYQVLLGAGASLGAKGGDKSELPTGPGLTSELQREFGLEGLGQTTLAEVFELAQGKKQAEGLDRYSYLQRRFSNCTPSWQGRLLQFRWRRIWTLNIDDVVEQAALKIPVANRLFELRGYSWRDEFRETDVDRAEVPIVHLHGRAFSPASGKRSEPDLVFAILEYLQARGREHKWHHNFGANFSVEPFVVVGAKLVDEIDLADFLRRGNESQSTHKLPSIVVLKEVEEHRARLLATWGLSVHEGTAEDFFSRLAEEVAKAEKGIITQFFSGSIKLVEHQAATFLSQFRRLDLSRGTTRVANHDFFRGDEPTWDDILEGLDVPREGLEEVVREFDAAMLRQEPSIHLLEGSRGSGKSAALLRIGADLLKNRKDVFLFRGEERLSVAALLWWAQRSTSAVFLFDDAADFAEDIGKALAEAKSRKISLHILASERSTRSRRLQDGIPAVFWPARSVSNLDRLSHRDAERLRDRLEKEGRLGHITRWERKQQLQFLEEDCGANLLVILLRLETAGNLEARLRDELATDIRSPRARDLYLSVCLSHGLGYPLPLPIAGGACGYSVRQLVEECTDGELRGLVRVTEKGLCSRHRGRASLTVEKACSLEDRVRLSGQLARSLAPFISPQAIHRRSIHYRLSRTLMDRDVVISWIGREAIDWYARLVEDFGWNARFWEQRALAEVHFGHFDRARSFAEKAAEIHADAFTLNTLGTIILRGAVEIAGLDGSERQRRFWDGVARLRESCNEGAGQFMHPYVTFFSYALRLSQRLRDQGEERGSDLLDEWDSWRKRAGAAPCFEHLLLRQTLAKFQREWLLLSVEAEGEV